VSQTLFHIGLPFEIGCKLAAPGKGSFVCFGSSLNENANLKYKVLREFLIPAMLPRVINFFYAKLALMHNVIKGVGRNIFREGSMENQGREIALISLPLLYQWRVRGRIGYTPRAHLERALIQEPRIKNENLVFEEAPVFGKNAYLIKKISGHFRALKSPLVFNHPTS